MPNYVEIQFSSNVMLDLLRSSLILANKGSGQAFSAGAVDYVVDSIDIYPTTSLRHTTPDTFLYFYDDGFGYGKQTDTIASHKVEIVQHLQVNLLIQQATTSGPVLNPGGSYEGDLIIQLDAFPDGAGAAYLKMQVMDFEASPISDPDLATALPKAVRGIYAFLTAANQLPPPDLTQSSGLEKMIFVNAGITLASQNSVVAVRLQQGWPYVLGTFLSWQQFLAGNTSDYLNIPNNPLHFAVLLSAATVENQVRDQIGGGLAAHTDTFRLVSGIGAHWTPQNHQPHVDADFYGEAIAACKPFGWDIGYNVTAGVDLSLPQANQIQTKAHVDWSGNFWDLLGCELSEGLLGFAIEVGSELFAAPFALPTVTGMGFLIGFFGAIIAASVYTPDLGAPSCTQNGQDLTCTINLPPNGLTVPLGGQQLTLNVSEMDGPNEGLVIGGRLPLVLDIPTTVLQIAEQPFAWSQPVVVCGGLTTDSAQQLLNNIEKYTQPVASATLSAAGPTPLQLISAQVVSPDPLGVFPQQNVQVLVYTNAYTVLVKAQPTPAYFQNPYNCILQVTTNLGKPRQVDLGSVPVLTSTILDSLRQAAQHMIDNCNVAVDSFYGKLHNFNVKWLIDPAPGDRSVSQLWQIEVSGMKAGAGLQAQDASGSTLSSVSAGQKGVARLRLINALNQLTIQGAGLQPGAGGLRVAVQTAPGAVIPPGPRPVPPIPVVPPAPVPGPTPAPAPTPAGQQADFLVRLIELAPQSHLNLDARMGLFDMGEGWLAALSGNGLFVFDIALPGAPRLAFQRSLEGARGTILDAEGVMVWGQAGLVRYDFDGWRPSRLLAEPVTAALRLGERLLLANASGLSWYDLATAQSQTLASQPGMSSLTYAGGLLAWVTGGQLFAANLAGLVSPAAVGRPVQQPQPIRLPVQVVKVEAPVLRGGPRSFLVSFAGGASTVYDLDDLSNPVAVEQFPGQAWFAGARAAGALLALPEYGGLSLYTAGRVVLG